MQVTLDKSTCQTHKYTVKCGLSQGKCPFTCLSCEISLLEDTKYLFPLGHKVRGPDNDILALWTTTPKGNRVLFYVPVRKINKGGLRHIVSLYNILTWPLNQMPPQQFIFNVYQMSSSGL